MIRITERGAKGYPGYWNYRIVKCGSTYAIHECHYQGDGSLYAVSAVPTQIREESMDDIKWVIHHMEANLSLPAIEYSTLEEIV
jgi:hypothetical protein